MSEHKVTFIPMANKNCTSCGHLVPGAKRQYETCHFSNGNTACPAAKFKLGVGVNVEKASFAIANAIYLGDALGLQKHVNRLATFEAEQNEPVLAAVFIKLAELNGLSIQDETPESGVEESTAEVESEGQNDQQESSTEDVDLLSDDEVDTVNDTVEEATEEEESDDEWTKT